MCVFSMETCLRFTHVPHSCFKARHCGWQAILGPFKGDMVRYYSRAMVDVGSDIAEMEPERPWKSTRCKTAYVCFLTGVGVWDVVCWSAHCLQVWAYAISYKRSSKEEVAMSMRFGKSLLLKRYRVRFSPRTWQDFLE